MLKKICQYSSLCYRFLGKLDTPSISMSSQTINDLALPRATSSPNYLLSLLCLLLVKSAVIAYMIAYGSIGLGPDEAQYWTWSNHLDWGYYSKPPAIAWQIYAGTFLFGPTEFGVRFSSLVIGLLLPFSVYYVANRCGLRPSTCFWAGATMGLCPVGIMASFLATTDGGFVLFWTLGFALLASSVDTRCKPHYLAMGFCILLGALFKWTAFTLWIVVVISAYFYPHLRSRWLIVGVLISLIGLFPSVVWNNYHDWATFRHVWSTNIVGEQAGAWMPFRGNFIDFLGAQFALFSPVYFVLYLLSLATIWKQRFRVPHSVAFCGWVSAAIFTTYISIALFKKMQGNWCIYAYPPAIVALCWYACDWLRGGRSWLFVGSVASCLLTTVALSIPTLQAHKEKASLPIPYSLNPFRHNIGWQQLEPELRAAGYDPAADFLFSQRYQTVAVLSFYSEAQKQAYFFNLDGNRRNQFSYWPGMGEQQLGKDGFFVVIEDRSEAEEPIGPKARTLRARLTPYFKQVLFHGRRPLFISNGSVVKSALIFQGLEYNGKEPANPEKF